MIQANELRIGNWIDEQGLVLQVGQIQQGSFNGSEPTPITEEWMLKLGFTPNPGYDNFCYPASEDSIYYFHHTESTKDIHAVSICHPMLDDSRNAFSWRIKYVHQLQNLIFALTGEELTIKP